jgi:acyl carrier protein
MTHTKHQIEHEVKKMTANVSDIDHLCINTDSHFKNDLGMDSLDKVNLSLKIDEALAIAPFD